MLARDLTPDAALGGRRCNAVMDPRAPKGRESPGVQPAPACPVSSYTEWDPLEEVIVGRVEGAALPTPHVTVTGALSGVRRLLYPFLAGHRYSRLFTRPAEKELNGFIRLLESEGITVRRPRRADFSRRHRTSDWSSSGFTNACPRDGLLVVGNEIIEAPMAWRSRYFERLTYHPLLEEYSACGARWSAAPRPRLLDALYGSGYTAPGPGEPMRYITTESEPVFDAADFVRCGRDLFVIRSNVTNRSGIDWLRRHLAHTYRIHEIETRCRTPMHIDTTLMPLAPGKMLANPEFLDLDRLQGPLRQWDILVAPEPDPVTSRLVRLGSLCSKWLSMNVLVLDERRVVVERHQVSMARALRDWGFEPIPCAFSHYAIFGGAFHCATLDVRRRGELRSYF